jgi:zinc protease
MNEYHLNQLLHGEEVLQLNPIFKSFQKKFLFIFLILSLTGFQETGFSATQESIADCLSTDWPSERSELIPDPSLIRGKLKNGFRYVLKTNHEPKDRVAIYLNVQAGSLHENDNQQGVAHFLEHMMFNGSIHFPPGSLVEYFQSLGMNFGGDTNAYTTHDETVYNIILPNSSEKEFDSAFLVMTDYARGALLLESEIDKERGVILAEKRSRDSAGYRTHIASTSFAFRGTMYPERMPIGADKTLEKADRVLLKSYYDTWYRPDNMILVIVGDIDPEIITNLIEKHFGELVPEGSKPQCPDFGKLKHKGLETFYHYEPELGKTNVSIQNLRDLPIENDSLLLNKNEILRAIGSMAFNYRLQQLQEEAKVPFADASYNSGDILNHIGYGSLFAHVEQGNWKETLSYLEQLLRQAISHGFRESEVERAKNEILAQLDARVLTADSQNSRTIAHRIIHHLNNNRVYQSAEQEKILYEPITKEITATEVNDYFSDKWSHNNRLISVTGDVRLGENGPEEIASIYRNSTRKPVTATVDNILHTFPYLQLPSQSNITPEKKYFEDIGIERLVFPNGLIVNLKKTGFEKNRIWIRADFGTGKQNEQIPGMAMLAEDVVNKSGSGKFPGSVIEELKAGSSINMSFRIGESAFSWTGTTLAKDFEMYSQLLHSVLLDPGFRKNAFTAVKANIELTYQKINREIEGALPLEIQPFLAGYNDHFGLPAWEDIAKLDFDSLTRWANPLLRPDDLEISVVGDFNRDEVISILAKYLLGIELSPPQIPMSPPVNFPVGKKLSVTVGTSVDKSLITVAWPTDDFWDIHRTRRLQLLASVFADKSRKIIREKLAASYSPNVSSYNSRTYRDYGYIISQMLVKPGSEDMVIEEILKISEQLQKNGVTTEELVQAKDPLMTALKERTRTNLYWLDSVLSLSARHPQQLDWSRTIIDDYTSISETELSELARKYLGNEKAAIVTVKPVHEVKSEDTVAIDNRQQATGTKLSVDN